MLLAPLAAAAPAGAADFHRYLLLTTDYVFRGVTYSDGHAAAQLGADLAFDGGFYAGAWASTVDIAVDSITDRDLEIDYYLGYRHDVSRDWSVGANFVAYTFPGTSGPFDYDYQEYGLSMNYADRAWLEYAFSPDVLHSGANTHNVSLYAEWPFASATRVGAGAGYYVVEDLGGDNYAYWQLGVTRAFSRFELDLRYHDASDWVPFISNPSRTGARVVLSFRMEF
ncbi:MAG TPA: TorF family putative porin [Woeseiaceae bacterium]